jgi:hypothetical protein
MNFKKIFLLPLIALALTGCISPKSYVDPTFGKTSYEDLKRKVAPPKWQIQVEFQRNGERYDRAEGFVKDQVEKVVRASGVATPTSDLAAPVLKVVLNNVADMGSAAGKGFGTGLTFGLVGSTVTDGYVMNTSLTLAGKEVRASEYKHAVHTTIGNTSGPAGLTPMTSAEAVSKAIEQMLLNALKDLEKAQPTTAASWFDSAVAMITLRD